ncbi:MAG: hypothetical protein JWO41_565 [Candidatus Saccharibacteria bacterium]|nr:hypothetical protein [Candidatus Saccharibacteria bacterium]
MTEFDKEHFSANLMRATERFQAASGKLGKAATWAVAGSRSPSYLQLNWQEVSEEAVPKTQWLNFNGNPGAGPIPRLWRTAYLLTMSRNEIDLLQSTIPEARPAVAIKTGDLVQIGTHPYLKFGNYYTDEAAIAGREGQGAVTVTAGLWTPEPEKLLVPQTLTLAEQRLFLARFEEPFLRNIQVI